MEGTEEKLASHISLKKWKRIFPYVKRIKLPAVLVLIFMLVSALSESVYPMFTSFAVNSFVVDVYKRQEMRPLCWSPLW